LAEDDSLGDMIQVTANARDYSSKNVAAIFRWAKRRSQSGRTAIRDEGGSILL
jgi:hypothetical protein